MAKATKEQSTRGQINIKNIPTDLIEKIQYIAEQAGASNNDAYIKAIESYIQRWEEKNHKIKLKPKTGSLEV